LKQFSVDAQYVAAYGRQVERAAQDALDAKRYAQSNGEISAGEQGWLALLGDTHKMIVDAVRKEIDGLAEACRSGAEALKSSAAYYTHTDEASAAKLDATLTGYNDRESYFTSHYGETGAWEPQ